MKFNVKVEPWDFLRISIEFWDILSIQSGNTGLNPWFSSGGDFHPSDDHRHIC